MIVFATLVIFVCLLSPQPGSADERSQMLWSRGLIDLQDGRYPAALERFQEAVDADPRDVRARYYRAVARERLGDREGAIADLRFVLTAEPEFDEAALDLGVTLVEEQQYAEALPWLEQARRSPALATRASLFIGIAQLRDNQQAAAKESFGRLVDDPEHGVTARYYAGVVDYQLGNFAEAKAAFTVVAQAQPGSAVGREAQRFLELLESPSGRWYSFSAALGLNYDSNVILAPAVGGGDAQTILGVSQKSDGEGVIRAGALLVPWQRGATVSLAYDFFQSYHFELVEFDLQAHTVSTQVSSEAGAFRFGLLGRYDYSLLDTQSFVQAATGSVFQ
jgi:Tfp pilus assembly protein PilF